eukprot:4988789-Pleurochrysis_carterae.AAC.1
MPHTMCLVNIVARVLFIAMCAAPTPNLGRRASRFLGLVPVEWFIRHFGRAPKRLDGHQHCHVASLPLARAVATLCAEFQIGEVRMPLELGDNLGLCSTCEMAREEAKVAANVFADKGI